jgi:hypothetical protein
VTGRPTRAERAAWPLARDVVKAVALDYGACIRPVQLRKTNLDTGEVEQVLIPCGATLARVCPPCAERARVLRAAQCREGWRLEDEPAADATMSQPPGMRCTSRRCSTGPVSSSSRTCPMGTLALGFRSRSFSSLPGTLRPHVPSMCPEGPTARCPRHIPSIAARAPAVLR